MHIFNLKICILKLEIVFSCPPETFVTASCPKKDFTEKVSALTAYNGIRHFRQATLSDRTRFAMERWGSISFFYRIFVTRKDNNKQLNRKSNDYSFKRSRSIW